MYKIYLKKICETLIKRKEIGPIEVANYISSVLRSRRIELKMTLSEVTENICSEAFLSKLERNLIDPRNDRVELLCERMNIDYKVLSNLDTNDRIEELLYRYFDNCYDEILEMNDNICDGMFIAQDELIKGFKGLINKDYRVVHYCVIGLDNVKECLSDIELYALLLLVFECYMNSMQYYRALEYITLLENFDIRNNKCKMFLKERKFILSCKMQSPNVRYLFDEIRKDFHLYPIYKQFSFILHYNETLDDEESYEYLLKMGKDYVPKQYNDEYLYANALFLTKLNKHIEAMKYIINVPNITFRFVSLYAYNLYLYNSSNPGNNEFKSYKIKLISLIKLCNQYSSDTYHIAFLRLMQYELDNSSFETICNYIKNQLLKELIEYSYPLYDDYIKDRYCVLLGKLCRYKDAYNFLLENKNHLKKYGI